MFLVNRLCLLLPIGVAVLMLGSCGSREYGRNVNLSSYHYCTMESAQEGGRANEARDELRRAFIMLKADDVRLTQPEIQKQTCVVSMDVVHAFWCSSAKVELRDFGTKDLLILESVSGGFMYHGADEDFHRALMNLADERRAAGPIEAPPASQASGPDRL